MESDQYEQPLEASESSSEELVDVSYRALNKLFRESPNILAKYRGYTVVGRVFNEATQFISFGLKSDVNERAKFLDRSKKDKIVVENPIVDWELKFHVSLSEENKDSVDGELSDYARAWEIVLDVLVENKVMAFKIAKDNVFMSQELGEAGKDITIYAFQDTQRDVNNWLRIIELITQRLLNEGIPPGYKIVHPTEPEYQIIGTNYVYYRYEKHDLYDEAKNPFLNKGVNVLGVQQLPRELNAEEFFEEQQQRPSRCCKRFF